MKYVNTRSIELAHSFVSGGNLAALDRLEQSVACNAQPMALQETPRSSGSVRRAEWSQVDKVLSQSSGWQKEHKRQREVAPEKQRERKNKMKKDSIRQQINGKEKRRHSAKPEKS